VKLSIIHLVVSWGVCVCGVQVKLSIIHLVGSGGVPAERAACLLITAAADSRHR